MDTLTYTFCRIAQSRKASTVLCRSRRRGSSKRLGKRKDVIQLYNQHRAFGVASLRVFFSNLKYVVFFFLMADDMPRLYGIKKPSVFSEGFLLTLSLNALLKLSQTTMRREQTYNIMPGYTHALYNFFLLR